mgnify:CR=1 FL=1
MSKENVKEKEKRKSMLEAGVIFSGGGAVLGLLVDKISQSGSYSTTRNGALIGAMMGIGLAAFSNALEEPMAKIKEYIHDLGGKVAGEELKRLENTEKINKKEIELKVGKEILKKRIEKEKEK